MINASSERRKDADEQRQQPQGVEEENRDLKVQVASLRAELASLTEEVKLLTADVETQSLENSALQKEVQLLKDHPMSVDFIRDCDKRTKFFTGLTTFLLFTTVFEFVAPQVQKVGRLTLMERIIGLLKNRYSILQSRLPITLIKRKGDTDVATVDKLLFGCAALTNFGEPVV